MPTYYCHRCARQLSLITPVEPDCVVEPTGGYQLDKLIKHTAPTGFYNKCSVFNDPSWDSIKDYIVSASVSGCLEIDDQNRKNLIYYAGKETGLTYTGGQFSASCSGVKLVCTEDDAKVHAFPNSFTPTSRNCHNCGTPVPYDS